MEIQGLPEGGRARKAVKTRSVGYTTASTTTSSGAGVGIPRSVDRVELSAPTSSNRALDAIRAKIAGGFYRSDEVVDDISDKLARLFDR